MRRPEESIKAQRGKGTAANTETHEGQTDVSERRWKKPENSLKTAVFADWFLHAGATGADTQLERVEPQSGTSFFPLIFHLGLFCNHRLQVPINHRGII